MFDSEKNALKEFIPGQIWTKRSNLRFFGLEIGCRMTVVKLQSGNLFLHSPVALTHELKNKLDSLGKVAFIVSPNSLHHLFIGDYFDQYHYATKLAPPGLNQKRKDLAFNFLLKEEAEDDWKLDFDQTIFFGQDKLKEVVFFHKESKTLILADLLWNIDGSCGPLTRLAARIFGVYNKPTPPLDSNLKGSKKVQTQISLNKILSWDFDKIILSHGSIIKSNGKEIFKKAFENLC